MRAIRHFTTALVALALATTTCAAQNYKGCLWFSSPDIGTTYYDVRVTPAGTVFERYSWNNAIGNMALVDTNTYAALHLPPNLDDAMTEWPETTWNEGVAFAATMQSRGKWNHDFPITSATWQRNTNAGAVHDQWRFYYTNTRGSSHLPLLSGSCLNMTGAAVFDPNRVRSACMTQGDMYYDVRTSPSGTTLVRKQNGVVVDTNTYAALHGPSVGAMVWNEGVGFAATMQTRNVWPTTGPIQAATWQMANGADIWRFTTTVNGNPTELVFRSGFCEGACAAC